MENEITDKKPAPGYEDIYIPISKKTIKDYDDGFAELLRQQKLKKQSISIVEKSDCLNDFQLFCKTYLSHMLQMKGKFLPFHPIQIHYVNEILSNKYNSLTELRIPRAWGKTTLMQCLMIFLICRNEVHNIMYVSATEDRASKEVYNLRIELSSNELLNTHFGKFEIKTSGGDLKIFNTNLNVNCFVGCYGIGCQVRGTKYINWRPDFIIADDLDSAEVCRNEKRLQQDTDWFLSELYYCVDENQYRITMLGNRFAHKMILCTFSEMKRCKTFILYALENNKSTWEDRASTETLLEMKADKPLLFGREKMHEPLSTSNIFPIEHLHFSSPSILQYGRTIAYFDSSVSIHGDFKAVVILTIIDNIYFISDLYVRQGTRESALFWLADKYKNYLNKGISMTMYYDSTFNQSELINISLQKVEETIGMYLPIIGVDEKQNKIQKIEMLQPFWMRDIIYFNSELENSIDIEEMKTELFSWDATESTSKKHDDGLDSLISAILLNPFGETKLDIGWDMDGQNHNHY